MKRYLRKGSISLFSTIRSLTGDSGSREEWREQTNKRKISVDISSTKRKTEEEISTERITDEVSAERITDEEISAERLSK